MKPSKVTVPDILARKQRGERLAMLTAYDYTFARLFDEAGIDMLLVGDSVGMVVAGYETTLPVTMDEMVYHCRAVARGARRAHIVGDMPFMSYQCSLEDGLRSAGRLVKEGGCHAVKLEGGAAYEALVRELVRVGIPVMGHIGLTPQSYHQFGGFKIQGKRPGDSARLLADAKALEQAGAYAIVLEGIPAEIAGEITKALTIPTIGIGAGVNCDGQVLVGYDALGLYDDFRPKFVRQFASLAAPIRDAAAAYLQAVKSGTFPAASESFWLATPAAPTELTYGGNRDDEVPMP